MFTHLDKNQYRREEDLLLRADVLHSCSLRCGDVEDAMDAIGLHEQRRVAECGCEDEHQASCVRVCVIESRDTYNGRRAMELISIAVRSHYSLWKKTSARQREQQQSPTMRHSRRAINISSIVTGGPWIQYKYSVQKINATLQ